MPSLCIACLWCLYTRYRQFNPSKNHISRHIRIRFNDLYTPAHPRNIHVNETKILTTCNPDTVYSPTPYSGFIFGMKMCQLTRKRRWASFLVQHVQGVMGWKAGVNLSCIKIKSNTVRKLPNLFVCHVYLSRSRYCTRFWHQLQQGSASSLVQEYAVAQKCQLSIASC